jgi:hypothetical protein
MNLSEHFIEARKVATRRFWSEFARANYDRDEITIAPEGIKQMCFEHADESAWRYLEKSGAMQLPEWTFQVEKKDGQPF